VLRLQIGTLATGEEPLAAPVQRDTVGLGSKDEQEQSDHASATGKGTLDSPEDGRGHDRAQGYHSGQGVEQSQEAAARRVRRLRRCFGLGG
jgi:hypothetical protein